MSPPPHILLAETVRARSACGPSMKHPDSLLLCAKPLNGPALKAVHSFLTAPRPLDSRPQTLAVPSSSWRRMRAPTLPVRRSWWMGASPPAPRGQAPSAGKLTPRTPRATVPSRWSALKAVSRGLATVADALPPVPPCARSWHRLSLSLSAATNQSGARPSVTPSRWPRNGGILMRGRTEKQVPTFAMVNVKADLVRDHPLSGERRWVDGSCVDA